MVMGKVPTVVCELDPPIRGPLPTIHVVRPYRKAVVKKNRITAGYSGSNNENGTYICVYDANNIYLTRVFVIAEVRKFHASNCSYCDKIVSVHSYRIIPYFDRFIFSASH